MKDLILGTSVTETLSLLEREYGIKHELRVIHKQGFTGSEIAIAVVVLVLSQLSAGFFSSAGKTLWDKIKDVWSSRKKCRNAECEIHRIVCVYSYHVHETSVRLCCNIQNDHDLESLLPFLKKLSERTFPNIDSETDGKQVMYEIDKNAEWREADAFRQS